jgi:hypothetical protein
VDIAGDASPRDPAPLTPTASLDARRGRWYRRRRGL